ncbi:MAG: ribonuclease HII, partial [Coriobacteriia bacterium]|nr:ribonuclease HII [Coriobacteriia bacterium]
GGPLLYCAQMQMLQRSNVDQLGIPKIRTQLSSAGLDGLRRLIQAHEHDPRAGVQNALTSARMRLERAEIENRRLDELARIEEAMYEQGMVLVAGIDEVGRGALAGPLTTGAVVLPVGTRIIGLDDSKRLSPKRREELAIQICAVAVTWHVAHVEAAELDAVGMTTALRKAMNASLAGLRPSADHALIDGRPMGLSLPETAVIGGDRKVAAIAAASILAKVTRDALMRQLDERFPGYDFALNKGYGTREHMDAIDRLGLTPHHRRSFSPCGGTLSLF